MVYKGYILWFLNHNNEELAPNELEALFYLYDNPAPKGSKLREQYFLDWKIIHTLLPEREKYILNLSRRIDHSFKSKLSRSSAIGIY